MARELTEVFPLTDDADADVMIGLYNAVWAELLSDRAPTPVGAYRARNTRSTMEVRHFITRDLSGDIDGLLITMHWIDGTNQHFQFAQIFVRADARRQGIGTLLVERAHDVATDAGRTTISLDTFDSVPAGEAFCEAIGAAPAIREHMNVVDVANLPTAMLETWRSDGPVRAPGSEMLLFEDGFPEELYEEVAGLWFMASEDMPLEDLDLEPPSASAAEVAEILENTSGLLDRLTAMPRHIESGELVGFSELLHFHSDPTNIQTTLTMVHRDHRGHALGKWAKAAVILRGLERWPDAVRIRTENAKSNAAMLAINDAIGFESRNTLVGYQITTDALAAYLSARTATP
jgi:GNAT superfamily N-acetyltransferase